MFNKRAATGGREPRGGSNETLRLSSRATRKPNMPELALHRSSSEQSDDLHRRTPDSPSRRPRSPGRGAVSPRSGRSYGAL